MKINIRTVALGALCAGALVNMACADGGASPTSPSSSTSLSGLAATEANGVRTSGEAVASTLAARSGALELTKECSEYFGLAGQFCTVTSSSVDAIEVGSKIIYAQPAGPTSLSSDIVIDPPGPGNNKAFGHCALEFATGEGVCSISGGTGKFTWLRAAGLQVSHLVDNDWAWSGTFAFSPRD